MTRIGFSTRPLLLVEDSDEDYEAMTRVLRKLGVTVPVHRCTDGDTLLEYLQHADHPENVSQEDAPIIPSAILLDLNLPGTDGREALRQIKSSDRLRNIPVTIITTSSNPDDVRTCYEYGANAYVVKPMELSELIITMQTVTNFWLRTAVVR